MAYIFSLNSTSHAGQNILSDVSWNSHHSPIYLPITVTNLGASRKILIYKKLIDKRFMNS